MVNKLYPMTTPIHAADTIKLQLEILIRSANVRDARGLIIRDKLSKMRRIQACLEEYLRTKKTTESLYEWFFRKRTDKYFPLDIRELADRNKIPYRGMTYVFEGSHKGMKLKSVLPDAIGCGQ